MLGFRLKSRKPEMFSPSPAGDNDDDNNDYDDDPNYYYYHPVVARKSQTLKKVRIDIYQGDVQG